MKRSDFFVLVQPLAEKLYSFSHSLLPDDLQAEQLVVDAMNAYLFRERKVILNRPLDPQQKKEIQLQRKQVLKGLLRSMVEIGVRRSHQMNDQLKLSRPEGYEAFYALDPKIRFCLKLRFEGHFTAEEIEDIMQIPRFEVIEKLHNGRFLLKGPLTNGALA